MHSSLDLAAAHTLFEPDSLGMVWNDAQWDPPFLKTWWPLLKKDGGLLLLHNVVGNGELSRWRAAPAEVSEWEPGRVRGAVPSAHSPRALPLAAHPA
jgi:hypothetical protein